MKNLRIFLLFAVFIFGATILRMLDVKATDSTAPKPGAVFRDCPDCPGDGRSRGWQLHHGLISRGKILGRESRWQYVCGC